jgi:hypothetical protein
MPPLDVPTQSYGKGRHRAEAGTRAKGARVVQQNSACAGGRRRRQPPWQRARRLGCRRALITGLSVIHLAVDSCASTGVRGRRSAQCCEYQHLP